MDTEKLEKIEQKLTWLNNLDAQGHNYFFEKNLFSKDFDNYYFMEYNDLFDSREDYLELQTFLNSVGSTKQYINSIDEPSLERLSFSINDSFETYCSQMFDQPEHRGFDILGNIFLQYDISSEWCFIHSRIDSLVIIGINKSHQQFLSIAFQKHLMNTEQMFSFTEDIYGLKLHSDIRENLFKFYNKDNSIKTPEKHSKRRDYSMVIQYENDNVIKTNVNEENPIERPKNVKTNLLQTIRKVINGIVGR
jgi:hypothetical protein